jgi:hypothetical protein
VKRRDSRTQELESELAALHTQLTHSRSQHDTAQSALSHLEQQNSALAAQNAALSAAVKRYEQEAKQREVVQRLSGVPKQRVAGSASSSASASNHSTNPSVLARAAQQSAPPAMVCLLSST